MTSNSYLAVNNNYVKQLLVRSASCGHPLIHIVFLVYKILRPKWNLSTLLQPVATTAMTTSTNHKNKDFLSSHHPSYYCDTDGHDILRKIFPIIVQAVFRFGLIDFQSMNLTPSRSILLQLTFHQKSCLYLLQYVVTHHGIFFNYEHFLDIAEKYKNQTLPGSSNQPYWQSGHAKWIIQELKKYNQIPCLQNILHRFTLYPPISNRTKTKIHCYPVQISCIYPDLASLCKTLDAARLYKEKMKVHQFLRNDNPIEFYFLKLGASLLHVAFSLDRCLHPQNTCFQNNGDPTDDDNRGNDDNDGNGDGNDDDNDGNDDDNDNDGNDDDNDNDGNDNDGTDNDGDDNNGNDNDDNDNVDRNSFLLTSKKNGVCYSGKTKKVELQQQCFSQKQEKPQCTRRQKNHVGVQNSHNVVLDSSSFLLLPFSDKASILVINKRIWQLLTSTWLPHMDRRFPIYPLLMKHWLFSTGWSIIDRQREWNVLFTLLSWIDKDAIKWHHQHMLSPNDSRFSLYYYLFYILDRWNNPDEGGKDIEKAIQYAYKNPTKPNILVSIRDFILFHKPHIIKADTINYLHSLFELSTEDRADALRREFPHTRRYIAQMRAFHDISSGKYIPMTVPPFKENFKSNSFKEKRRQFKVAKASAVADHRPLCSTTPASNPPLMERQENQFFATVSPLNKTKKRTFHEMTTLSASSPAPVIDSPFSSSYEKDGDDNKKNSKNRRKKLKRSSLSISRDEFKLWYNETASGDTVYPDDTVNVKQCSPPLHEFTESSTILFSLYLLCTSEHLTTEEAKNIFLSIGTPPKKEFETRHRQHKTAVKSHDSIVSFFLAQFTQNADISHLRPTFVAPSPFCPPQSDLYGKTTKSQYMSKVRQKTLQTSNDYQQPSVFDNWMIPKQRFVQPPPLFGTLIGTTTYFLGMIEHSTLFLRTKTTTMTTTKRCPNSIKTPIGHPNQDQQQRRGESPKKGVSLIDGLLPNLFTSSLLRCCTSQPVFVNKKDERLTESLKTMINNYPQANNNNHKTRKTPVWSAKVMDTDIFLIFPTKGLDDIFSYIPMPILETAFYHLRSTIAPPS